MAQWTIVALVTICALFCDAQSPFAVPMPKCTPSDETCLRSAAMMGLQLLSKANSNTEPPLPSMDPLVMERVHVNANLKGEVRFTQDYYDMEFRGMSKANVTHFSTTVNSTHVLLNFTLYMDLFEMLGWYRWNGTIMGHLIDGYGECNITSVDVAHTHMLTIKRGKEDYLSLSNYKTDLNPKVLLFSLPNIVRDNPEESTKMEQFFHDYAIPIFNAVKADYDRTFGKIFYPYACSFFKGLKYSDVFLPEERERTIKQHSFLSKEFLSNIT